MGEPVGSPVGSPVGKGPWATGTWVWHVRTKRGPWVVIKDDGGAVVYVDPTPNSPATVMDGRKTGTSHKRVTINHPDVSHHYRSMLTDKAPPPTPSLFSTIDWNKAGQGIGAGIGITIVALIGLFILWLELGAPH